MNALTSWFGQHWHLWAVALLIALVVWHYLTRFIRPALQLQGTLGQAIEALQAIQADAASTGVDLERIAQDAMGHPRMAHLWSQYAHGLHPYWGEGPQRAPVSIQQNRVQALADTGLPEPERRARAYPHQLSGGQRQRVAMGRALARQPQLFLFDEPLSNLDAALRVKMRIEIAKLHKELNSTIIYVTHDQVEAMTLANRIVVFNGGRIEQVGKPMDLYHRPANLFVAGFIGSPKMNFVQGQLAAADASGAQVRLPDGTLLQVAADARALPAGSPVTLGLRPEHLGAQPAGDALPANALRGTVQAAEHLGDSTYFYLDVPGAAQAVVVRADPENPLAAGDTALLAVPPQRAHLFDANGQALPRA